MVRDLQHTLKRNVLPQVRRKSLMELYLEGLSPKAQPIALRNIEHQGNASLSSTDIAFTICPCDELARRQLEDSTRLHIEQWLFVHIDVLLIRRERIVRRDCATSMMVSELDEGSCLGLLQGSVNLTHDEWI